MRPDLSLSATAPALAVTSGSEERTELLGRAIGLALRSGDAVLISGELGAGKTCMVRGMAEGTGSPTAARSPTFVLVNEYPGRVRLSHCDLYRISGPDEVDELALDERMHDGALIVEWPELGPSALPSDALLIQIDVDAHSDERTIVLTPRGERSGRLLSRAAAVFEAFDMAGPEQTR